MGLLSYSGNAYAWPWLALTLLVLGWSLLFGQSSSPGEQPSGACCAVLELRQYTLYPGKRDVLIDLFEREFIESQALEGMHLAGQFRDLGNPDRFVWMRGFPDMNARREALQNFYGGPVWKAHRDEANATMADSSNVLLLKMVNAQSGFAKPSTERPPVGTTERPRSLVVATIYELNAPAGPEFAQFFERVLRPLMTATGARPIAYFQTEPAENNFPRLPVRTGENVFVWFSRFANPEQYAQQVRSLEGSKIWKQSVGPALARYLKSPTQHLRLQPTPRSALR